MLNSWLFRSVPLAVCLGFLGCGRGAPSPTVIKEEKRSHLEEEIASFENQLAGAKRPPENADDVERLCFQLEFVTKGTPKAEAAKEVVDKITELQKYLKSRRPEVAKTKELVEQLKQAAQKLR